ncbi:hypothetical protein CCHR01_17630 [Colletotrichum chrysophilum]|uniref:Uncharacterized protein n=1 Tax=Colletotrichum chrysophilum TaxID=1836956 RepID=A0AAD9ECA7_9PEZI|nr:hypothetical protein CCHR01_17630 [Colletotrichum chrysophilum]
MTYSSHTHLYRVGRLSWLSIKPTELFYITSIGKLGIFSGSCAAWATDDQTFLQDIRGLSRTVSTGMFSFETQHGPAFVQFLTDWRCFADIYPSFVNTSHFIAIATFNRCLEKVGVRQEPSRKVLGYARLLESTGTSWKYVFSFPRTDLNNEAIAFIPCDKGNAIWSRMIVQSPRLEEVLDFVQLTSDASVSGAAGSAFAISQDIRSALQSLRTISYCVCNMQLTTWEALKLTVVSCPKT